MPTTANPSLFVATPTTVPTTHMPSNSLPHLVCIAEGSEPAQLVGRLSQQLVQQASGQARQCSLQGAPRQQLHVGKAPRWPVG